tara:strand:+ start:2158 stop:3225 length:1068 start_codon:yes stop_codon:yes gene_type:complete
MAFKKYGYYIKGNKIAIVEQSESSSSGTLAVAHCTVDPANNTDKDTCEAAGGQWIPGSSGSTSHFSEYMSPTESVADGLEIQYSYSPTFNLQSTGTEGSDFHRFIGWGSDGSNLLLFTFSGASSVVNLSSLFAADGWIYISGSGRWSGLHQVKSTGGTTGILTLKTKCNLKPSKITVTGTFEADDETFIGDSSAHIVDIETFKDIINENRNTPYIFIDNAANGANHGLFSLSSNSTSGKITLNKKISIDTDGDYTETAAAAVDGGSDEVTIYNAFYEQISVYEGVEVMEDESFELDIPRYQANAIVYYLKAKMAEDENNIEMREFFMREFKRQLEKSESSKKRGPYIIQGFKEMR